MAEDIQHIWNTRYLQSSDITSPAEVVLQNQHLLPSRGKALDLACGLGANAMFLASQGLQSNAWDISTVATEKLKTYAIEEKLKIAIQTRDVLAKPPLPESFDVIVVHRFLERALFPLLINALNPGGLLFYETFIQEKVSESGPTNPEYLLERNELLQLCSALQILFYREEALVGDITEGFRDVAMMVGSKSTADSL